MIKMAAGVVLAPTTGKEGVIVTRESVAKVAKREFSRDIKAFARFSYNGKLEVCL